MPVIKTEVPIERQHPDLPGFVVVPAASVAPWKLSGTTTIEGTLDGVSLGRRSLKRWDDRRWFIELRKDLLEAIGKSAGDRADLVIRLAPADLPDELQGLIDTDEAAGDRWKSLTDSRKRMLREEILSAKTSAARERRARKALLPEPGRQPVPVGGLPAFPRQVLVRVVGKNLPGRTCGPYTEVAVGLPVKAGCPPTDLTPGDARQAKWETTIQVGHAGGVPAFRGSAVNGPPLERFLYLTWIGREGRAAPAMFRRAKLRLDAIPPQVLSDAVRSGLLVGRLSLTGADGMPTCASVRPPSITWTSK